MTNIQAVVLGVVQGITEFLPISSTAHLRLIPALAGWSDPGAAFTAVLQLGTLAAVLVFFARDLGGMVQGALRAVAAPERRRDPEVRLILYLVVGTLPVVIAGLLFRKAIHGGFRALPVIATTMVVVGVALGVVERLAPHRRSFDELTFRDALLIGLGQSLALVPGVSRSGITLLVAMAIGMRRDAAARFSFLLSIPAVAGAGIFEMKDVLHGSESPTPLLIGLAVAAVTGYASVAWLLRYLRTRTTMPFVIYRIIAGIVIFALIATGHLVG